MEVNSSGCRYCFLFDIPITSMIKIASRVTVYYNSIMGRERSNKGKSLNISSANYYELFAINVNIYVTDNEQIRIGI